MIKIAFVIDTIESPTAGTEKQLLLLIKHLDRSKFLPYLCVLRSSEWLKKEFKDCELIDIEVPSFSKPVSYLNMYRFVDFLKSQQIDIIQTHFIDGNKVGVLTGKLAGVKTIVSTRRNQGYWHNKLELLLLSNLNRWVTRFLANSNNTKLWAAKVERIDPQRIDVIHNGLDIECYFAGTESQRVAFRQELGFPATAIIVGIIANLRPVKAVDVFIRAAKIISQSCPTVRFVIIGDGPDRTNLEHLCTELKIGYLMRFLGKRLDIPEVLSVIDIGLLSSNSESFSNSIVEYLGAGLPVVCTDVGGAREAVEDGVNGFVAATGDYVGLADKIKTIVESKSIETMGKQSRNRAEELFSVCAIMYRYGQFYERLVTR